MLLTNYFRVAARSLRRNKGYSAINVLGLAIGMVCCILIVTYVRVELSFDKHHEKADRIVRVALDATLGETTLQSAMSAPPLAAALQSELPDVEAAARIWRDRSGEMTVYAADREFKENRVVFADANIFDVLTIPLLRGDAGTSLAEPFSVVLSESMAEKYFGNENPIGKTLQFREPSDRDLFEYEVTGVMADMPPTSHLEVDFLASFNTQRRNESQNWMGFGVYTYALLRDGTSIESFEEGLQRIVDRHLAPQVVEELGISYEAYLQTGQGYNYFAQPIRSIHLRSAIDDEFMPNGSITYVWMYSVIAIFILLIASINFVNLTTARAIDRAKEVGVRKSLGAQKRQLLLQFLSESMVLGVLAIIVTIAIIGLAVPMIESFTGVELGALLNPLSTAIAIILLGVLTGLLAGIYPAVYLSRFRPVRALTGKPTGNANSPTLRNVLVVFQYSISIVLVAATLIVYQQTSFLMNKHLGFDTEPILVVEGVEVIGRSSEAFRNALRDVPGVISVTNSERVPGRAFNGSMFRVDGQAEDDLTALDFTYASFDFVETLGLEIVDGRSLDRQREGDSLAVILNETAVARLGIDDPIGKNLIWDGESTYSIVGVVKDFHVASLHRPITPVALLGPDPRNTNRPNLLAIARVDISKLTDSLAEIEQLWYRFAPDQPFAYSFLEQDFEAMYNSERTTSRLVAVFALLAILVASIGLFGLAAFSASRRTKEIGIRKVLGASVTRIVTTISQDYLLLVAIGFLVAVPVVYLTMTNWLASFAYQVEFAWGSVIFAGVVTFLIAVLTVSYQSIRAALQDPVRSLRYE